MMIKSALKKNLGIYWEGDFEFNIPSAANSRDAAYVFRKNMASITWNSLSVLEQNPVTFPQTETILKGQSVTGISIDDLMQVKHFGDGAKELFSMVLANRFSLSKEIACRLHNLAGKEDALTWGVFRNSLVTIRNVNSYTPPESHLLDEIADKGFEFLNEKVTCPKERAFALFLFMAGTQFFHDANKRTASLMMNGVLMQAGFFPVTVRIHETEVFHVKLNDFYNTGNASEMMRFFEHSVSGLYSEEKE